MLPYTSRTLVQHRQLRGPEDIALQEVVQSQY